MPWSRISLMDASDRDLIHETSLNLLERVGVRFGSSTALRALEEASCQVDHQDGRVRIPRQLVEGAVGPLKRDVLLAGRNRARDAILDGSRTFCTVAGICPSVVDMDTRILRSPRLDDLAKLTRIADALDAFGIVWYAMSPTDGVAPKMTDLAATACLLQNTDRHVMGQIVEPAQVPYALEILKLCAEFGSPGLHPLFSVIYCPVAPLQHDGKASDAAMVLARNYVPIDIFSLGLAGATAPVTLAGAITQTNCEVLSAVVLLQLVAPGWPLIYSANAREQRRLIQIVFQNPRDSLNPRRRIVEEIVRPGQLLRGLSGTEARSEVTDLMERVRLQQRLGARFPAERSGGELQRAAIARALAAHPDLIICDEVTSALDVSVQAAVPDLLENLRRELGLTLLFISHDLGVVASIAGRVLVFERGTICDQGDARELLAGPKTEYAERLVDAAPSVSRTFEWKARTP